MATRVYIKHDGPGHHKVDYETYNPKTGEKRQSSAAGTLNEGEEVVLTIYDSQAIRIIEGERN